MTTVTDGQAVTGTPRAPTGPRRHPGTVAAREAAAVGSQRRTGPQQVDGAVLWCYVRRYLSHYVAFRTEAELDRTTAWVFHACARKRGDLGMGPLIWRASPRLLIKSRKRGAGKSTLLDLVVFLTGSRGGKVPRITPARLAQIIGQAHETVCIDEGRLVFGAGQRHEDLQACLLAGYTPGTSYQVSKTTLSLFGAVAIATKESLITEASKAVDGDESSLGDLLDRCLTVTLTAPEFPMPEVGARAEAEGGILARALVAWTDSNRDALIAAAQDIADDDLEAARNGETPAASPRALQIGRPLRAVGRVIDQQTAAEQARRGVQDAEPQCEATILACLGAQSEDIMAELEELSGQWGDGQFTGDDEDLGQFAGETYGRVVYDEPAPAPEEPVGLGEFAPAPSEPPTGSYSAMMAVTFPGFTPATRELPGPWGTLGEAQKACEEVAGEPLEWKPSKAREDTWGAVVETGDGTITNYAVALTAGE